MHVAVIERAAVVRAHDEKADRLGVELLQHLADGEEVAQRLRHLFVVDVDEAVVHPHLGQRHAVGAFALGDFVFVVRKLQIGTAAVDVEGFAQQCAAHGRALDVPAGAAEAIGAVPLGALGFGRLGGFPQHEVERVLLGTIDRHALTGLQLVERLARQLAVAGELAHGVVHVAVGRLVGQALVLQFADDVQHLRHVVGGARVVVRPLHAQGVKVAVHLGNHAVGELPDGFAVFQRAADDLVLDVGDVAHEGDPVAAGAQPPLHDVKRHGRTRMADVAQVVHRDAAHVHAHVTRVNGRKVHQPTRERVVDAQGHGKKARKGRRAAGMIRIDRLATKAEAGTLKTKWQGTRPCTAAWLQWAAV